jgi:hypothetical protein
MAAEQERIGVEEGERAAIAATLAELRCRNVAAHALALGDRFPDFLLPAEVLAALHRLRAAS